MERDSQQSKFAKAAGNQAHQSTSTRVKDVVLTSRAHSERNDASSFYLTSKLNPSFENRVERMNSRFRWSPPRKSVDFTDD